MELAREYVKQHFGVAPVGLWPSEGSVSDEVFMIASELGFEWSATDSGVLDRTQQRAVPVEGLYRPYEWRHGGQSLRLMFRDHFMSDLIGFVYSRMEASHAAADFLHRIKQNCTAILAAGRDALVPIILDGENAWEYYDLNGRPFLRELYRRISEDSGLRAVTASEAFRLTAPEPLDHIFPGSWINANFDVWIGAEEDNQAWTQLLRARSTYDSVTGVPEDRRHMAFEELMIAEGSDWCWWYGPEHDSANRVEFDQLYRSHLANVYRFLNLAPPEELSRPILKIATPDVRIAPTGPIRPTIDGEVTSYFEWLGAGLYQVDERSGSMHGKKFLVKEVLFGSDGARLFIRVDFRPGVENDLAGMEARIAVQSLENTPPHHVTIRFAEGAVSSRDAVESAPTIRCSRLLSTSPPSASSPAPACASNSPCGPPASPWTPSPSRIGSKCTPQTGRKWPAKGQRVPARGSPPPAPRPPPPPPRRPKGKTPTAGQKNPKPPAREVPDRNPPPPTPPSPHRRRGEERTESGKLTKKKNQAGPVNNITRSPPPPPRGGRERKKKKRPEERAAPAGPRTGGGGWGRPPPRRRGGEPKGGRAPPPPPGPPRGASPLPLATGAPRGPPPPHPRRTRTKKEPVPPPTPP